MVPEDVEVVAREIREETLAATASAPRAEATPLPEPTPTPAPSVTATEPVGDDAAASQLAAAAPPLALDLETAGEVSRLIARMQSSHLEERLTRLEHRVEASLTLLQQLLDAVRLRAMAPGSDVPTAAKDEQQ